MLIAVGTMSLKIMITLIGHLGLFKVLIHRIAGKFKSLCNPNYPNPLEKNGRLDLKPTTVTYRFH
jgi:hypothetical protein